jgi:O-acetyl-ADP-ribose deacetylase (regulator of RNase III)
MSFKEIKGNLFTVDKSYALCHCVGNDFSMGAGIAVEFKRRFGNQQLLIDTSRGIGTSTLLTNDNANDYQYIFYMVTKKYSKYSKPTLENLKESLEDMVRIAEEHGIRRIACPRIGCGLDKLLWSDVKDILIDISTKHGLDIVVYYL